MSTLQISLAILGVVLLGLIMAYNAWMTRRNTPKRADPNEAMPDHGGLERYEPGLDGLDVTNLPPALRTGLDADPLLDAAPGQEAADGLLEPGLQVAAAVAPPAASSSASAPAAVPAERRLALDPLIDAIAHIQCEHAIGGDAALQVQPTTRRAGSKPFRIEGFNEASQQWETVRAGQRYAAFQAGVQLANRLGALNEIEYSDFVAKVQTFADALGGALELPEMLHEVARARELDQFASDHDAQLHFKLRPRRAAWSPGYIHQHAGQLGFVPSTLPGRLILPSAVAGHHPVLVLGYDAQAALAEDLDQSAVHALSLSLDVPQVPREEQPFARLREVAQALGQSMDGVLCDQNDYPLQPQVLDPIASDLELLYDKLDSRELSAGSMLARRLFN